VTGLYPAVACIMRSDMTFFPPQHQPRRGRPAQQLCGRGLHSSTFQLNVSVMNGIGDAFRGYSRGVTQVSGDIRGWLGDG